MDIKKLESLVIKFETADMIPPPFSHQILLETKPSGKGIEVDFQIAYIYREELSEEEIIEEGFTLNDDYAWKGLLDMPWIAPLQNLLTQTPNRFNNKALEEEQSFLEISVNNQHTGTPQNQEEWEYFLQELIQAIYETSQKEAPFHLDYRKIGKDKTIQNFELNLYYAVRKAEGITTTNGTNPEVREITWEEANNIIQNVFIAEFIQESALKSEPKNTGKYLAIGDGLWYEFGKSLKRPHGNKGYLSELERTFDGWID